MGTTGGCTPATSPRRFSTAVWGVAFGVLSGAVFLHEPLTWRIIAGGLLVVAGVLLTQRQARDEEVVLSAA